LESIGWCNSAASWGACPAGVVRSQQDQVNDPVSDPEKAQEMAEAGTDWPGFSSGCLGGPQRAGISAIWRPRHFLAAGFLPLSRFALA
jgi:hypothetical protein